MGEPACHLAPSGIALGFKQFRCIFKDHDMSRVEFITVDPGAAENQDLPAFVAADTDFPLPLGDPFLHALLDRLE